MDVTHFIPFKEHGKGLNLDFWITPIILTNDSDKEQPSGIHYLV